MVFAPFGSDYGNVWTYLSFQFQMNKKERVIFEFEMGLKKFVGSNVSNDDNHFLRGQVCQRVWILKYSEIGSGFREPGSTPPPSIPSSAASPPRRGGGGYIFVLQIEMTA